MKLRNGGREDFDRAKGADEGTIGSHANSRHPPTEGKDTKKKNRVKKGRTPPTGQSKVCRFCHQEVGVPPVLGERGGT